MKANVRSDFFLPRLEKRGKDAVYIFLPLSSYVRGSQKKEKEIGKEGKRGGRSFVPSLSGKRER